ncbi:MAG: AAA family ATPase, partial [Marinilabiliaceae bacterium]|nr:AAA family ATPase [Marinilabiliaceae bacterium]
MTNRTKYPIGIQTFSEIVEENYLYVDKTEYVYNLTHNSKFVFLSRPRRFGKSLLTSTLEAYFEARKELFANLKLGQLEKEWVKYPVFRFDVSEAKKQNLSSAESMLSLFLDRYEEKYGRNPKETELNARLTGLIHRAYQQTGQKVVILIDEYDSPMLEVMHDTEKLQEFRNLFRSFYSPIKSCDQYIRFAFITGITKFSQLSIFSEINNLKLISMSD